MDNRKKKTIFHHSQETVTVNPYSMLVVATSFRRVYKS